MLNHKELLLKIYKKACSQNSIDTFNIKNINTEIQYFIKLIAFNANQQKGVFTVLATLITHKILHQNQDIRKHQANMLGGFSGRSIDTTYITPTFKEIGLPSMAESGWLTRSLEQPYPYNLDYNGKINNKSVKEAFLNILDFVEKTPASSENILLLLLFSAIQLKNSSVVKIVSLENPEHLTINNIISSLNEHFSTKYHIHGGSKLPVLAFYAIYQSLINEVDRYKNCLLAEIGSHTASDRTSKTSGDIEIFKDNQLFESIEIKLDKLIDSTIVRVAIEKIQRYSPTRYYILSHIGIKKSDESTIDILINNIKNQHGCQIIVNGLLPTIKYYLRLVGSLNDFVVNYSNLIEKDAELQKIHKDKWNELIEKYLNT
jgi:DNA (cytosine-5)-methyltransferase 1